MLRREKKLHSRSVDLEDDDIGEYLTYRPLSNLPTPPPSRRKCVPDSRQLLGDGEYLKPQYLGPAIHLVNLIPPAASLATPSVPFVQAMLTRANLPVETIALAVCVLDSIDKKFARNWRVSCPLQGGPASRRNAVARRLGGAAAAAGTAAAAGHGAETEGSGSINNKRHTLPAAALKGHGSHGNGEDDGDDDDGMVEAESPVPLHIDSVEPEVIILGALAVAVKFVEDPETPAQHFCRRWSGDVWSSAQLNATVRCLMEAIGWRIMSLWNEDLLADAMVDMQLAVKHHKPAEVRWSLDDVGRQLTPDDSGAEDGLEEEEEEEVGAAPGTASGSSLSARQSTVDSEDGGLPFGLQPTPPNEDTLEEHFRDLEGAALATASNSS